MAAKPHAAGVPVVVATVSSRYLEPRIPRCGTSGPVIQSSKECRTAGSQSSAAVETRRVGVGREPEGLLAGAEVQDERASEGHPFFAASRVGDTGRIANVAV
jgi:hypothetical protein